MVSRLVHLTISLMSRKVEPSSMKFIKFVASVDITGTPVKLSGSYYSPSFSVKASIPLLMLKGMPRSELSSRPGVFSGSSGQGE